MYKENLKLIIKLVLNNKSKKTREYQEPSPFKLIHIVLETLLYRCALSYSWNKSEKQQER